MRSCVSLPFLFSVIAVLAGCGDGGDDELDAGRTIRFDAGVDAPRFCSPGPFDDRGPRGDGDFRCPPEDEGVASCFGRVGEGWTCRDGCWHHFYDDPCGSWVDACGTRGVIGGTCDEGACGVATCQREVLVDGARATLASLGVPVGEPDPDHPGFYRARATPDASDEVPVPIASGSLCTRRCDTTADEDACGVSATCSTEVGTLGFFRTPTLEPDPPFGDATGWCRADCSFDPATRGGCIGTQTCSPASRVCVDGCVADVECQTTIVTTWDGARVSVRDTSAATCDAVTGRCRWTHDGEHSVGDACDDRTDCTADFGVCLNGTCGELDCANASDTGADSGCDGGRGVCVATPTRGGSVCIAGCSTLDDCRAPSVCVPFATGTVVGGFTGYCAPRCDTVSSFADDVLVACRSTEVCDMPGRRSRRRIPTGPAARRARATMTATPRRAARSTRAPRRVYAER